MPNFKNQFLIIFISALMEFINLALILIGFVALALYLKKPKTNAASQFKEKDSRILVLEKEVTEKKYDDLKPPKRLTNCSCKNSKFRANKA